MKVLIGRPKLRRRIKVAVSIGVFDGVHLGHQYIFKRLAELSRSNNIKSLVITFFPHPDIVLKKQFKGYITTDEEKYSLIQNMGVDFLWAVKFTKRVYSKSGRDFLNYINRFFEVKFLVAGRNFSLGRNKDITGANFSRKIKPGGPFIKLVKNLKFGKSKISSSYIRRLIKNGDFQKVSKLIGRPYSVSGRVTSGRKIAGRVLGFPTVNIDYDGKILPLPGVFLVLV